MDFEPKEALLPYRILNKSHKKGTTKGPMGSRWPRIPGRWWVPHRPGDVADAHPQPRATQRPRKHVAGVTSKLANPASHEPKPLKTVDSRITTFPGHAPPPPHRSGRSSRVHGSGLVQ